jgi:hypothetical protein
MGAGVDELLRDRVAFGRNGASSKAKSNNEVPGRTLSVEGDQENP